MKNENKENKENIILTDEELKVVAGGASGSSQSEECNRHKKRKIVLK